MKNKSGNIPQIMLGTAMWGWTLDKATAFALLDHFYGAGFRLVDCATNYPIDKNPEHFRWAETTLLEWIQVHGIQDLEVNMKVGSLNNLRTPDHNLSKSFLLMNLEDYLQKFGQNLRGFMVHWDNREAETDIEETFEALQTAQNKGLRPGLSGIRFPHHYAKINKAFSIQFDIQIKHNLLQSDYERYHPFHGQRSFYTYGINAGGIKLKPEAYRADSSLKARSGQTSSPAEFITALEGVLNKANVNKERPAIDSMNQLGMIHAFHSPDIKGIILGPSRVPQLEGSVGFYEVLREEDYFDVFQRLQKSRDF